MKSPARNDIDRMKTENTIYRREKDRPLWENVVNVSRTVKKKYDNIAGLEQYYRGFLEALS